MEKEEARNKDLKGVILAKDINNKSDIKVL